MTEPRVSRTELTPVSFLQRTAYVFPDRIAVVHSARRCTYRQLEERVNRLASALCEAGMKRHDRVAFLTPNIPAMLEANRICIVRLGALGDVVNTLPALDALRAAYPGAYIAWLVESPWQDILPGPPRLDETIVAPKREWLAKLRSVGNLAELPGEVARFVRFEVGA